MALGFYSSDTPAEEISMDFETFLSAQGLTPTRASVSCGRFMAAFSASADASRLNKAFEQAGLTSKVREIRPHRHNPSTYWVVNAQ